MNCWIFHSHKLEIPRKKLLYESSNRVLHVFNNNCLQASCRWPNKTKFDVRISYMHEFISLPTVTQYFI